MRTGSVGVDQWEIDGVDELDQGALVDWVACEEHFVAHEREQCHLHRLRDGRRSDLPTITRIGETVANRARDELRYQIRGFVEQFVVGFGAQAPVGVDAHAMKALEDGHEDVQNILAQRTGALPLLRPVK